MRPARRRPDSTASALLPLAAPNGPQVAWAWRDGPPLTADQRNAVTAVLTSGRVVDTVVGAAGTGKTTTLRAVARAWLLFHPCEVLALAPSATAAHVLGDALGVRAETTAKWLFETQERPAIGDDWWLRYGQLIVLDEASLADTPTLAAITRQAAEAGAKLLLVGDPAQRSAIGPGGGFGMLAHQHTTARLTVLHRFVHPWEAAATLRVRSGDPGVVDVYRREGRVTAGAPDDLLDRAVAAAATDTGAGKVVMLQAADTSTVLELNARAHAAAVRVGRVGFDGGVPLADDATAAVGDRVLTRRNDRRLRVPDGFVRNGDPWTVIATRPDGSLAVRPAATSGSGGFVLRLPAPYVREHVELGYATTTARAQGATVDVTRTVVTPAMAREDLYVAVTRGREHNQLYVPTAPIDPDCPPGRQAQQDADEILRNVLATTRIPATATETWAAHHPGEPVPIPPDFRPQVARIDAHPQIPAHPVAFGPAAAPAGRVIDL